MLSRVAENLYWLGRYTERAEAALRLLRTVFTKLHGEEPLDSLSRPLLLRTVTQLTCTYPGFMQEDAMGMPPDEELLSVVLDADRGVSFLLVLDAATFTEIARAELPHPVLFGYHGQFYGDLS